MAEQAAATAAASPGTRLRTALSVLKADGVEDDAVGAAVEALVALPPVLLLPQAPPAALRPST